MLNRKYKDHQKVQTIGRRTLEYARNLWHKNADECFPKKEDYETYFAWECAVDQWYRDWDSEFVPFVNGKHLVFNDKGRLQFVLEPWSE